MSKRQPNNICIIGDKGVGKNTFKSMLKDSDVGVIMFKTNLIPIYFNIINSPYQDKLSGAIVMFDITNKSTFKFATKLIDNLPDIPIVLVGNKTDIDTSRVSSREIQEYIERIQQNDEPKEKPVSELLANIEEKELESELSESIEVKPKAIPKEKKPISEPIESIEEKPTTNPKKKNKLEYFEISCKMDKTCDEPFLYIARELTGNKRLKFE